ncbi:MAG: ribosome recycling factor [Sulfurospirillum sp.]|jgi:ribosome recycling factor|nr:ribosome recycling factor [Sulfurospirillum sp.]DAB33039.1 MAG TPA: ribosome recycling factor [Sulfurospirillum sp. UBA11407]DAB35359.1 MAG TPA: ribosome recycling factor [Sulfurospirillum sp. UBA12182]
MELNNIYATQKEHIDKSLAALKKDFTTIRSGAVSVSILDGIKVSYYGTPTALNQVATVLANDATTITITPWERNLVRDIEHAISAANIGVNPNNDGECIKLFFPPMTVDQRKENAKQAKSMGEKTKVAIRNIRKEANDKIKKLEKDKAISEDESKKAHDEVQKITDAGITSVDEMVKVKEAELLKV